MKIKLNSIFVDNQSRGEYQRLKDLGVMFTMEPTPAGPVIIAIFSDTCGNLIQLYQPSPR